MSPGSSSLLVCLFVFLLILSLVVYSIYNYICFEKPQVFTKFSFFCFCFYVSGIIIPPFSLKFTFVSCFFRCLGNVLFTFTFAMKT